MGLDQPAAARYLAWLGGLAIGDFGTSYTYGVSVWELVRERIGLSLPLAVIAICLSTVLAITLGVLAAQDRNRAAEVGGQGLPPHGFGIRTFRVYHLGRRSGWEGSGQIGETVGRD